MKDENIITNILTLAVAGLLILLTGLSFYFFRDFFAKYLRFLLPIPPLAVAAYIYVYNMFDYFQGDLPVDIWETIKDLAISIAVTTSFFTVFSVLMVVVINALKKILS